MTNTCTLFQSETRSVLPPPSGKGCFLWNALFVPMFWLLLFEPDDFVTETDDDDDRLPVTVAVKTKVERSGLLGPLLDRLLPPKFLFTQKQLEPEPYTAPIVAANTSLQRLRNRKTFTCTLFSSQGNPAPYFDIFEKTLIESTKNENIMLSIDLREVELEEEGCAERMQEILRRIDNYDKEVKEPLCDFCGIDGESVLPSPSENEDDDEAWYWFCGLHGRREP